MSVPPSMSVLFCPFCREPFEDAEACPDHGLALVDFRDLPPASVGPDDHSWLPFNDLRFGRGWLLLGSCLLGVSFFVPFASMAGGFQADSSLFELAQHRAKTVWMIPVCAAAALALFFRRRTPLSLRRARLVVMWLALVPFATAAARLWGAFEAAERLGHKLGQQVVVSPDLGAYGLAAASVALAVAATQLGKLPRRAVPVRELT